ncbi:MAG: hypothetical protein ACFFDC_17670 [Promethearchaeota archaeon]
MLNQEINEKNQMKKEENIDQIQALRTLGIIWLCLGATNPVFFILGLVFLATSVVQSNKISNQGGLA